MTFSRNGLSLLTGAEYRSWSVSLGPFANWTESMLLWDVRTGAMRRCFSGALPYEDVLSWDGQRVLRRREGRLRELDLATGKVFEGPKIPNGFGGQLAVS